MEAAPFDFITQQLLAIPEGFRREDIYIDRLPVKLERGVMTRLDLGVCYRGYFSDHKVVICLGEPAREAVTIFEHHRERQEFMKSVIRPGATKKEVYDLCMSRFTDIEKYCFWIHGIGLDLHEEPRIGSLLPSAVECNRELTFEAGQVLCLEPSWLVEDMYSLADDGFRRICTPPQEIFSLG